MWWEKTVENHEDFINGNGTPGVKVLLDRIQNQLEKQNRLTWIILSTVVTSIIGFLLNHFIALAK